MKTKLTMLLALAGLFTLNASAQDDPVRPGRPGGPGGEGGRGTGRPQPSAEDLKKYDKDADGKLSEEERTAMRADREKAMLEKYDADKNGKLDEAETKKMREENPRGRGGPGGPGGGRFQPSAEDIKKYDADKDGKLSDEETKTMREARQKEMLEKYDADKDGKLSDDERQKMFEDIRKQRGDGTRPVRPGSGERKTEEKKTEPAKLPVPETK